MNMPKPEGKPFAIPKPLVWEAWRRVKANRGAPGVDGQALGEFEADLGSNLWNRMSSGSYFPPPVRAVEIPKPHGPGTRTLGVRHMQTRDDEDLAIEQLRSPATPVRAPRNDLANAVDAPGSEAAAADRAGAPVLVGASIETVRAAGEQAAALQARLNTLTSPEVKRLEAAERRERDLTDHREELQDRLRHIPQPSNLPFASDRRAHERQNLQSALDAVDTEMTAVRTLRTRLAREIGEPDQIRGERAAIEGPLARALSERDRLRDELVADELASHPRWAVAALGTRPNGPEQELWDRATRGLARYRLEHGVTDQHHALGERPTDRPGAERYAHAQAKLERVRHELGLDVRDETTPAGRPGLPPQCGLRRNHAHHTESAHNQAARAAELETQAASPGWRHRHEREQLRHDTALQRQHAERHASDANRIELELQRLRAAGRHPDQWLKRHAHDLIVQLAANAELERRQEQQIANQVERAVAQPPEHVRDVIGERPVSDATLADQ